MFTDLGEAEGKKKDKINNQRSCNSIVFLPNRFSFSAIGKLNVVVRHIMQGEVDGDPRCRLPGLPTTLTGDGAGPRGLPGLQSLGFAQGL